MRKQGIAFVVTLAFVLSMIAGFGYGLRPVSSSNNGIETGGEQTDPVGYRWDDSDVTRIVLDGDSITVDGDGATVDGSTVTVVAAGSYSISGTLTDGQVIVDTDDEDPVTLILNGASISSTTSAPLYVADAEQAVIVLEAGTENTVSDGASYVFDDAEEDEPNAAIFSKSDLTITGDGTLTVAGNYNDGIASKDGLLIAGGTLVVSAVDDGIRGKDSLGVEAGNITVAAQGDGLKSDNDEDVALGYITVESGAINVTAGGDALQAETNVLITGGDFVLFSGGGSSSFVDESTSAKGIKAAVSVQIDGGTFTIDSADDAIHSNDSAVINGGAFTLASGDDGIHADATLDVNGGDITVTTSYEGLESAVITINAGTIRVVSSDDGINVAGGNDGSGMMAGPGRGGPGGQGGQGSMPGQGGEGFAASGDYYLYINGGYIVIDAAGDGLDSNGSIEMTDGVVIVNGPTEQMNGALDYQGAFNITGGVLVAAGSSGMAQAPGESSTQPSLLLNFDSMQQAGTLVHIQTSDGRDVLTFAPAKAFQSIAFSSPDLTIGTTYDVSTGGSADGTVSDGLYQAGTYTPGTTYTSFTISGVVTQLGHNSMFR